MGGTNALHRLGIPVSAMVFQRFIASFDLPAPVAPLFDARAVKQVVTHVIRGEQDSTLRNTGVWRRT